MTYPYRPKQVSAPGTTLLDLMGDREISRKELAEKMGLTQQAINGIIEGKVEITETIASKLEQVFGVSTQFWVNREATYRAYLARKEGK